MKYSVLLFLCSASGLYPMEQVVARKEREWDAQMYAKGNKFQQESILSALQKLNISFKGKEVLDVGCGAGNIPAFIALEADRVCGIDASKNMVDYAQNKYRHIENLTFEHRFAEDIQEKNKYDRVLVSFCLHWIEEKEQALKAMSESLKEGGVIFIIGSSAAKEKSIVTRAAEEIFNKFALSQAASYSQLTASKHLDDDELSRIALLAGLTNISLVKHTNTVIFNSREEVENFQRPVFMSRPFVQTLSNDKINQLFGYYIDAIINKMEQNDQGHYLYPANHTVLIAHK